MFLGGLAGGPCPELQTMIGLESFGGSHKFIYRRLSPLGLGYKSVRHY